MKNVSLVLNIVLIIAVGVLYYLHFAGSGSSANGGSNVSSASASGQRIVYINSDSVLKHYTYLEDISKVMEAKQTKLNNEFRSRAQGLQNEFNEYQRNVGNLTLSQAKSIEEGLAKKEQNLRMYEQSLSQELSEDQDKIRRQLYEKITDYLKEYGKANGLHVVLKFDPTSDVLFAGDSLDITSDVIKGLNEKYKEEKTTVKADSTTKGKK